jgi:hypothetical protein
MPCGLFLAPARVPGFDDLREPRRRVRLPEQLGLQTWVSDVFYGGVLVISVTISTLLRRRST